MFPISWYVALLVGIPEGILTILIGFSLFNLKIDFKNVLIIAVLEGIIIYVVRLFPIMFGIHTVIALFATIGITYYLIRITFWKVVISVLAGFVVIGAVYSVYTPLYITITSVSVSSFAENQWLNVIHFIPFGLLMTFLYRLIIKYKLIFFDLS